MTAIREYYPPIPTRASKAAVSDFAERLAEKLSFDPSDSIFELVSQLGGTVIYRDVTDKQYPESITVQSRSDFSIFLPSMTSLERDRFTIAHELGHLFLHFPLVIKRHPDGGMEATRWVDESDADLQRCEWEANWFAASFTMPASAFTEIYKAEGVAGAASAFRVSSKAAQVRASSLDL